MARSRDITGQRFGRLTAIEPTAGRVRGSIVWRFACDCGASVEKQSGDVVNGKIASCGCLLVETSTARLEKVQRLGSEATKTHGLSRTRTFSVWSGMLQRCTNPDDPSFANYGGRGIAVCARWMTFENFLADMGLQPAGLQIDRIDNDKGYEPGNCRWVTARVNSENRRSSRKITHAGRTMNIKQWAAEVGLSHQTIAFRLRSGWSVADALTTPKDHGNGWKRGTR